MGGVSRKVTQMAFPEGVNATVHQSSIAATSVQSILGSPHRAFPDRAPSRAR